MQIRDFSNTSVEELALAAVEVFERRQKLTIMANRARSIVPVQQLGKNSIMVITDRFRERLLSDVMPKQEEKRVRGTFIDMKNNLCMANSSVLDRCKQIIKERHPRVQFYKHIFYAVVDKATNTELMPADMAGEYGMEFEGSEIPPFFFEIKESAFQYTLRF